MQMRAILILVVVLADVDATCEVRGVCPTHTNESEDLAFLQTRQGKDAAQDLQATPAAKKSWWRRRRRHAQYRPYYYHYGRYYNRYGPKTTTTTVRTTTSTASAAPTTTMSPAPTTTSPSPTTTSPAPTTSTTSEPFSSVSALILLEARDDSDVSLMSMQSSVSSGQPEPGSPWPCAVTERGREIGSNVGNLPQWGRTGPIGLAKSRKNPGWWVLPPVGAFGNEDLVTFFGSSLFLTFTAEILTLLPLDELFLQIPMPEPISWSDLAIGPGPDPEISYLFILDGGPHRGPAQEARSSVVITRVSEIFADKSDFANMTMEVFTVNYPDGGAFISNAIFVDQGSPAEVLGTSGRVYIITRSVERDGAGGGQLFFVDLPSVVTPTAILEFTDTGVNLGIVDLVAADITSDGNLIGARSLVFRTFFWTRPCETVEQSMAQLSCPGDYLPRSRHPEGFFPWFGDTFAFGTSESEYDYFMYGVSLEGANVVQFATFYKLPATPSNPHQSCVLPQTTPSPDPNAIEILLSNGSGQEQLVSWYANYVSVPVSSVTLRNPPGVAFDLNLLQLDAGEVIYYEAENRNLTCFDPDFLRTLLLNMRFDVTLPASDEARVVAAVAQLVSNPEAFVEAFLAVLPTFFPGIQQEICNGTVTSVSAVLQPTTTTTTTTTTVPWDLPWGSSQLRPTPPRRLAMLSYTSSPSEFVRFGGVLTDEVLLYRPRLGPLNWTDVTPAVSGPGPRFEGTFAYSPDVGGSLVFGGRRIVGNAISNYAPNNVYLLTGTGLNYSWTEVAPAAAPSAPSQRRFHTAVVVQKDGAYMMLIYGGNRQNSNFGGLYAFFLGNSTWRQLQPDNVGPPNYPAPRWGHSAVLVPESYRMIVFAGRVQGVSTNELWAYDIGDSLWTQLTPATQGNNGWPEVRYGQIAVWGSQGRAMIVASGRRPVGTSPTTPRFWQWYEFPDLNGTWVQFEYRPDPDNEVSGSGVWDTQNQTMYYGFQNGADILWTRVLE
ncbi:unnamed protein product [Symbiodinium sp. CCMP2592]|nr:unnamed protein product [Symbiodinium sp. CCMP2592]